MSLNLKIPAGQGNYDVYCMHFIMGAQGKIEFAHNCNVSLAGVPHCV